MRVEGVVKLFQRPFVVIHGRTSAGEVTLWLRSHVACVSKRGQNPKKLLDDVFRFLAFPKKKEKTRKKGKKKEKRKKRKTEKKEKKKDKREKREKGKRKEKQRKVKHFLQGRVFDVQWQVCVVVLKKCCMLVGHRSIDDARLGPGGQRLISSHPLSTEAQKSNFHKGCSFLCSYLLGPCWWCLELFFSGHDSRRNCAMSLLQGS